MNIVSTMVGLSIVGAASPMMLDMSLAPIIAQKRATNFGIAESAAVVFSAQYEGKLEEYPRRLLPSKFCGLLHQFQIYHSYRLLVLFQFSLLLSVGLREARSNLKYSRCDIKG